MSQQGNNLKLSLLLFIIAFVALAAGYSLRQLIQAESNSASLDAANRASESIVLDERRPDFSLPDLNDQPRSVAEWDGKVLLVNFWATWCPPCKREIPDFIEVRQQLGAEHFEVIGIAIDNLADVREYVQLMDIPYPILVGEREASRISTLYGNRMGGLPYSVLIDHEGIIRKSKTGEYRASDLLNDVQPLLQKKSNN
jgi:thiol-disulfide isomerase/thioredoxin